MKNKRNKKKRKVLPRIGCYLGWAGCTDTPDNRVGDGWVCDNCAHQMTGGGHG